MFECLYVIYSDSRNLLTALNQCLENLSAPRLAYGVDCIGDNANQYIGCFYDDGKQFNWTVSLYQSSNLTINTCLERCRNLNRTYAILQVNSTGLAVDVFYFTLTKSNLNMNLNICVLRCLNKYYTVLFIVAENSTSSSKCLSKVENELNVCFTRMVQIVFVEIASKRACQMIFAMLPVLATRLNTVAVQKCSCSTRYLMQVRRPVLNDITCNRLTKIMIIGTQSMSSINFDSGASFQTQTTEI